jgi:hypothetical protein
MAPHVEKVIRICIYVCVLVTVANLSIVNCYLVSVQWQCVISVKDTIIILLGTQEICKAVRN